MVISGTMPRELVIRIGSCACYDRPVPTLHGYDALLTGTQW
jgi:hypothetical protein